MILNLEKEFLEIFDYTLNKYSRMEIIAIFLNPLKNEKEIILRQNILKGLLLNNVILKNYTYSKLYFNKTYEYLNETESYDLNLGLKLDFVFNRQNKYSVLNNLSIVVYFFHDYYKKYVSRLNSNLFPDEYQKKLEFISSFFEKLKIENLYHLFINDKIKLKDIEVIIKVFNELKSSKKIDEFWRIFFEFEAYISISTGIKKHNLTFPEINKSNDNIVLKDIYFPTLPMCIKNNVEISSNVFFLSGPNSSGKSTFLKTVSICIYLGHLGLALPGSFAKFPIFDHFLFQFNKSDSIKNGNSHFMTDLVNLKSVLIKSKYQKCFAVFDELYNGTNPSEGTKLLNSTISGLKRYTNSCFLISSHLELNDCSLSKEYLATYHFDCVIKSNKPYFNFIIKEGYSDLKLAKLLYDNFGLDELLKSEFVE